MNPAAPVTNTVPAASASTTEGKKSMHVHMASSTFSANFEDAYIMMQENLR